MLGQIDVRRLKLTGTRPKTLALPLPERRFDFLSYNPVSDL